MTTALSPESTANAWDRATYAFLAENQRRSGSDTGSTVRSA